MLMRTERNKEHTKEESRTCPSENQVNRKESVDSVQRMFQSVVFFLSVIKLKTDKETK